MIRVLEPNSKQLTSTRTDEPVLLCAADENYVRPLAVVLHSAVQNLRADSQLQVILMDGGISESSWMGLKETLVDLPIEIHVIKPDRDEISDLSISHHITHTAYLRLLAGRLLPETIDRVIYLDSDVLVQDDLTKLWELPVNDDYCLAVPDIACPYVSAKTADVNFKKSCPYMAALSPIANWRELGLRGEASYFNSGVMVLNLERWRRENIEVELLACLRDNPRHVWCWDQYALNVVFADQWSALPARWNQGAHVFEYPDASHSPIDQQQFIEMRDRPAIIHFTTEWKLSLIHI